MQEGNLETAKLSAVIRAFEELHPSAPPLLKSTITRGVWKRAVRESLLVLARGVPMVKKVETIEENLVFLPDM